MKKLSTLKVEIVRRSFFHYWIFGFGSDDVINWTVNVKDEEKQQG